MDETQYMSSVFDTEPVQWGLRGDPYLWNEMKACLNVIVMPKMVEDFTLLLEATFAELTGGSQGKSEIITVERYPRTGMSGGKVSAKFWRETAFPLLIERYKVR